MTFMFKISTTRTFFSFYWNRNFECIYQDLLVIVLFFSFFQFFYYLIMLPLEFFLTQVYNLAFFVSCHLSTLHNTSNTFNSLNSSVFFVHFSFKFLIFWIFFAICFLIPWNLFKFLSFFLLIFQLPSYIFPFFSIPWNLFAVLKDYSSIVGSSNPSHIYCQKNG